ncbi:MAG: hypothetical protein JNM39_07390 [Bdellovibrionaceae bacterium]|nr:hypothetical protein [Pseudobdellovibrionaceae bacterium]
MMVTGGIKTFSALASYLNTCKEDQACFVDTSILFSATYDSDAFNSESETAFDLLAEADFSIFTNVNVRSEFLENHRRVLIPEILIDLLVKKGLQLDSALHEKLKSHRTSYQKRVAEEKNTKMDPIQIKMWRRLLLEYSFEGIDGWTLFCRDFLKGKIRRIWQDTEKFFALNFISSRFGEESPYLDQIPTWDNAVDLMERYGLASFDAIS